MNRTPLRKLFLNLILVTIIVVAGAEFLARLLIMSPSPQRYDTTLGFTYEPHAEVFWGVEGFARNRYNALGLNSPEIGPKTREWRALIIGDSYIESRQVARDENFATVAERLEPRLELVNAGREGLNAAALPTVAERLVPKLAPDLTVIVLSQARLGDFIDSKVSVVAVDGKIEDVRYRIEDRDALKEELGAVLRNSALLTTLAWRFRDGLFAPLAGLETLYKNVRQSFSGDGSNPPPETSVKRVSPDDALGFVLRRLRVSGRIAILYFPHLDYRPGGEAVEAPASAAVGQRIAQVAAREGIAMTDALPEFLAAYRETGRPLQGFTNTTMMEGHLNIVGQAALGRALVRLVDGEMTGGTQIGAAK